MRDFLSSVYTLQRVPNAAYTWRESKDALHLRILPTAGTSPRCCIAKQ
jgi:hypothetical protein